MGGLPRVAAIGLRRPANSNFDVEYAERTQTCQADTEARRLQGEDQGHQGRHGKGSTPSSMPSPSVLPAQKGPTEEQEAMEKLETEYKHGMK